MNSGEVEELILFPLSDFVANEAISEVELQTFTGPLLVKYYPHNGEIIWGATAMILSELIEILRNYPEKETLSKTGDFLLGATED